ncbi:unnamed protein product, partial [Mesorhabditis belari]|uniref:Uncharacterized protein n=1 Tax=Mesorhabditis belari TaxID=2138241 RepID=A0AAF3F3E5_9BILA
MGQFSSTSARRSRLQKKNELVEVDFSDASISIPPLAPDDDDHTKPDLAALDDWDDSLYDKSPTIQNVTSTGTPANNCGIISSITLLLAIEEIRKLLHRKANAAALKTDRTDELSIGTGPANTFKAFRRIIQRIPFAETLFESDDANFKIMRPLNTSEEALSPAFGGVTKGVIGWLEAVNAKSFSVDFAKTKNPYLSIKDWRELDHSVAWLKISDDEFEMISNETHAQMKPHEKVHLEMVVMKRDQANLH